MGMAKLMKPQVARNDFVVNPSLRPPGTLPHDFGKGDVEPDLKFTFAEKPLERVRHVKFVQRQDRARIGREPLDCAIRHRHWKNAKPIALKEDLWINHRTNTEAGLPSCHSSLVTRHFLKYPSRLKAFSIAFFFAAVIFLTGCADPLEKPMVEEVPAKFQRGITGNGTLGPIDRSDDPTIRETHP
jgi:hypothetical protein